MKIKPSLKSLESRFFEHFNYWYPHEIGGKKVRSFDVILKRLRLLLDIASYISIGFLALSGILYVTHFILPWPILIIFVLLLFIVAVLSLYLGVWHSNLTSRQRWEIYTERNAFKPIDRIQTIKNYISKTFVTAIIANSTIIILVTNNYILAPLNSMYNQADEFIRYTLSDRLTYYTLHTLIGNSLYNNLLIISPIFLLIYLYINSYRVDIRPYRVLVEQWITSRYFKDTMIDHLLQDGETEGIATIEMGVDSESQSKVIMNTDTRVLNTAVFGLIGTGKSAAIAEPFILRDLKNIIQYIRKYAQFIQSVVKETDKIRFDTQGEKDKYLRDKKEEWYTKGFGKNYTNGLYLNEPSGSMTPHILKYMKRLGIPKRMVWLIDPLSEDTEAVNILVGSVSQAAGLTADLFRTFSDENGGGSSFFMNKEEQHTLNVVRLIKETSKIADAPMNVHLKRTDPTLFEFNQILFSSEFIEKRAELLKYIIKREEKLYRAIRRDYDEEFKKEKDRWVNELHKKEYLFNPKVWKENCPSLYKKYTLDRDTNNRIDILKNTYSYFVDSVAINERSGEQYYKFDVNIEGLKAVVNRMSSNVQIRRLFFSRPSNNIDIFLKTGGVILVNSAKAELGESASKMVAQIVETTLQNAVFRRNTDSLDPYFMNYGDERNTFLMPKRDQSYLDQNRKFKSPVLHLFQNYEQIATSLGRDGADALMESYRNTFTFQQGSEGAVDIISRRAGTKKELVESYRRGDDNVMAGNENNASAITEKIEGVEQFTETDVSNLTQFEFAGVMVVDGEVSDIIKVTAKPIFFHEEATDPNFEPVFTYQDKDSFDYTAYNIWEREVERYYEEKGEDEFLEKEDFDPEDWAKIISILPPKDIIDDTKGNVVGTPPTTPNIEEEHQQLELLDGLNENQTPAQERDARAKKEKEKHEQRGNKKTSEINYEYKEPPSESSNHYISLSVNNAHRELAEEGNDDLPDTPNIVMQNTHNDFDNDKNDDSFGLGEGL